MARHHKVHSVHSALDATKKHPKKGKHPKSKGPKHPKKGYSGGVAQPVGSPTTHTGTHGLHKFHHTHHGPGQGGKPKHPQRVPGASSGPRKSFKTPKHKIETLSNGIKVVVYRGKTHSHRTHHTPTAKALKHHTRPIVHHAGGRAHGGHSGARHGRGSQLQPLEETLYFFGVSSHVPQPPTAGAPGTFHTRTPLH